MSNKVCPRNCVADCRECELEEKKLKALEIIRAKQVDTRLLFLVAFETDLGHYNNYDRNYRKRLTQKEFDLLKEVLK